MHCFIALGGNFDHSLGAIIEALHMLAKTEGISGLRSSRLYQTSPVSPIVQPPFLNAAACFDTTLSLLKLFSLLETIEKKLGKLRKEKEAPRLIDIDLLYYGNIFFKNEYLEVPHPRLHERLFVLAPLSDLRDTISLMQNFRNVNNEQVVPLSVRLPYDEKS